VSLRLSLSACHVESPSSSNGCNGSRLSQHSERRKPNDSVPKLSSSAPTHRRVEILQEPEPCKVRTDASSPFVPATAFQGSDGRIVGIAPGKKAVQDARGEGEPNDVAATVNRSRVIRPQ